MRAEPIPKSTLRTEERLQIPASASGKAVRSTAILFATAILIVLAIASILPRAFSATKARAIHTPRLVPAYHAGQTDAASPDSASEMRPRSSAPPVIPVGLDAFRMWERWPYLRIGARAYMRSTYDRAGGNEAADASHFLYQLGDDFNVTLDLAGTGILYFSRYNHWHGSPWHYVVDGTDHVVQESSTADPNHPVPNSVFLPQDAFPNPLTWTWSDTRGADLTWLPVGFQQSFQMAYSRTHYGTGYYIYQMYVPGARLSSPVETFTEQPPDQDVLDLIARAGSDLAPKPDTEEGQRLHVQERSGGATLPEADSVTLTEINSAPSMLRALELSIPREEAVPFSRARLRVTWDGRPEPSIDSPIALFFGAGTLYNRDGREFLVKAFPVNIRFDDQRVYLACYFPMPFFHSARIELAPPEDPQSQQQFSDIHWSVRYVPLHAARNQVGYFHATYRDHPNPEPGKDLVLLDTREAERASEWAGHLVGTSFIFSHGANLSTLEGDPRFFFDDSLTPQVQGTGTEEWGGGGDYWGGRNMTLAFVGHPTGAPSASQAQNEEDKIESAYRFLLSDLMPFGRNAIIGLEHGGEDQSTEHYKTVAFWYGMPQPTLIQTDELKIGDAESERAHRYNSPLASEPAEVVSRYEWGVDHLNGQEIFPAESDSGRTTTGTSEFTLKLDPDNWGVLLRRKLDYSYPNQRAEVWVRDAAGARNHRHWRKAGVWYLAGSNTIVYSNPSQELGATQHVVKTSNRRFRDDEFLIGRDLTRGRSSIRLRVRFTPVEIPLYPGYAVPALAWSEMRYTAYCFVTPGHGSGQNRKSASKPNETAR